MLSQLLRRMLLRKWVGFTVWDAGVCAVPFGATPAQKEQQATAHIVGKRRFLQAPPMSLIRRPPLVETLAVLFGGRAF